MNVQQPQQGTPASQKIIFYWLISGAVAILVQILLGGITRITESGLSITEWKPIAGALPPLNNEDWQHLFEQYQTTDQYIHLKNHFTLNDFKFIFFWEWVHRLWARFIGILFVVPLVYFMINKWIDKRLLQKVIFLFLLGLGQALMGWLMVKSGLQKGRLFVEHVMLTLHFILALITLLLCVVYALQLNIIPLPHTPHAKHHRFFKILLAVITLQLIYGAFMAGLHAGTFAPTWPTVNGDWLPHSLGQLHPWYVNFTHHPITVQWVHRGLAYTIFILIAYWSYQNSTQASSLWVFNRWTLLSVVGIQIFLGITTVLSAPIYHAMMWFAIAHQTMGIALFLVVFLNFWVYKKD